MRRPQHLTLGSDPTRSRPSRQSAAVTSWQLPGPDSHWHATTDTNSKSPALRQEVSSRCAGGTKAALTGRDIVVCARLKKLLGEEIPQGKRFLPDRAIPDVLPDGAFEGFTRELWTYLNNISSAMLTVQHSHDCASEPFIRILLEVEGRITDSAGDVKFGRYQPPRVVSHVIPHTLAVSLGVIYVGEYGVKGVVPASAAKSDALGVAMHEQLVRAIQDGITNTRPELPIDNGQIVNVNEHNSRSGLAARVLN